SDNKSRFFTPSAAHHRPCANGRSILIVSTCTLSSLSASLLKRWVSSEHTPVSTEGTVALRFTFPSYSFRAFSDRSFANTVKSGATSPTLTSVPSSVTGSLLNVTCTTYHQPFLIVLLSL